MRRALQTFALCLALGTVLFWAGTGAQAGWTKTSVPVKTMDEVTGIEGITYERKLVPGLDFLFLGLAGAGLFGGLSLLFRKTKQTQTDNKTTTQLT